jgi:hypothetical protein
LTLSGGYILELLEEGVEEIHHIERPMRRLAHKPRVALILQVVHSPRDVPGARSITIERLSSLPGGISLASAGVEDVFKRHDFSSWSLRREWNQLF